MNTKSNRRRMLGVESLEPRQVMSGLVGAKIEGGWLVLRGDTQENEIAVWKGANANQVVVAGANIDGVPEGATKVNGSTSPVVLEGFKGGIRADLREGSDKLVITNLQINGGVVLEGGKGEDRMQLSGASPINLTGLTLNEGGVIPTGSISVRDSLIFSGGSGNDEMTAVDLTVGRDLVFNGGAGNDISVLYGTGTTESAFVNGNLVYNGNEGDDLSFAAYAKIKLNAYVNDAVATNSSTVTFFRVTANEDIRIVTSQRDDSISLRARAGKLFVDSGAGNDFLSLEIPNVLDVTIITGAGNDSVFATGSVARRVFIDTGDGNDSITLTNSQFDSALALLGAGDDILTISGTSVTNTAEINGGLGTNTLIDGGGNTFGKLIRRKI